MAYEISGVHTNWWLNEYFQFAHDYRGSGLMNSLLRWLYLFLLLIFILFPDIVCLFLVLAKRKINTDFCSSFLFTPENFTHTRVRLFNRIYSFSFLFKSYKIFIIFSFYMNTLNVFVCGWVWWGQRDSWIIYQF